jgi:hypothetical protein
VLFHKPLDIEQKQEKQKETLMTQSKNIPVITSDHGGKLVSALFASREAIVNTTPVEHETGKAVMATINGLGEGDFVVRSTRSGKRRSFHVLAGAVPAVVAKDIPGFASIVDNRFIITDDAVLPNGDVNTDGLKARTMFGEGEVIVLDDGDHLAEMVGAVRVN